MSFRIKPSSVFVDVHNVASAPPPKPTDAKTAPKKKTPTGPASKKAPPLPTAGNNASNPFINKVTSSSAGGMAVRVDYRSNSDFM